MDGLILIVGGAFQGKLEYALANYRIREGDICNFYEGEDLDINKKVLYGIEEYILQCLRDGENPQDFFKNNITDFKDKIVIACDISSGVVPVDPEMRLWREQTGRCLSYLSTNAQSVVRVFCGIGTVLK